MCTIVKSFDIRKNVSPGFLPGTVLKMDQFTFQGAEETFHFAPFAAFTKFSIKNVTYLVTTCNYPLSFSAVNRRKSRKPSVTSSEKSADSTASCEPL